jgi:hypothetical protein
MKKIILTIFVCSLFAGISSVYACSPLFFGDPAYGPNQQVMNTSGMIITTQIPYSQRRLAVHREKYFSFPYKNFLDGCYPDYVYIDKNFVYGSLVVILLVLFMVRRSKKKEVK